jgi:hypothetical protein
LKLSSGSVQGVGVESASAFRATGNNGPLTVAESPTPRRGAVIAFCGDLYPEGGGGAAAALVLRSGSLRAVSKARLSLWAARSAFSAAAVVIATCGVTL